MENHEDSVVTLTGNPFVDTGLAVIAFEANLESIYNLKKEHLIQVFGNGDKLAERNQNVRSFIMIFTTNSLLTNPGIKDKNKQKEAYKAITKALLDLVNSEPTGVYCESCGERNAIDFPTVSRVALRGIMEKDEPRFIGRDWFPLAGAMSDVQALPAASRSVNLCAKCLFAVHYLPWATPLYKGYLVCFQSNNIDFWYGFIRDMYKVIISKIDHGDKEILGKSSGTKTVIQLIINYLNRLETHKLIKNLSIDVDLYLWLFSNSGTGANCEIEEIPNKAISFLYDAINKGLLEDVEKVLLLDKKGDLLPSIINGKDFFGLYPTKKYEGVSPEFFIYYHSRITSIPIGILFSAYQLVKYWIEQLDNKQLKRIQRKEVFEELEYKNQARKLMIEAAFNGRFLLDDYIRLFQVDNLDANFLGWRILRYFLNNNKWPDDIENRDFIKTTQYQSVDCTFLFISNALFKEVYNTSGEKQVRKEIFNLGRIAPFEKVDWLQRKFLALALKIPNINYLTWRELTENLEGVSKISEVIFQIRLHWAQKLSRNEGSNCIVANSIFEVISDDNYHGIPKYIENLLKQIMDNYDKKRVFRDLISRLSKGELTIYWFKNEFVKRGKYVEGKISEDDWDDFCKDENGNNITSLRFFQLRLALNDMYRNLNIINNEESEIG